MSPPRTGTAAARPGRVRKTSAQRREEILLRSARLFQERGYTGVSIDDLGADLGISGPALYRHFSGKEAILAQIGLDFLDGLRTTTDQAMTESGPPEQDRLTHAVVEYALDRTAELTVCIRHLWHLGPDRLAQIEERFVALRDAWVPVIVAAYPHIDPQDAGLYVRAGSGLLIGADRAKVPVTRPRLIELVCKMVTGMLSARMRSTPPSTDNPTSRGTWERASRRELILQTAISLFRERGFRGVSMAEIAEAVGITAAAPYRHFKNKEDILETAILRSGDRIVSAMGDALADASSAEEALDKLLRSYTSLAVAIDDLIAVRTTEAHYLGPEALLQRRKTMKLFTEEWTHCLSSCRPDLSAPESNVLVVALVGLVSESVRSRSLGRRPHLDDDLYQLGHAVLHYR
ncbi:TetR/AcrR family transcriptional regulator [Nocardia spumae]|uniref:TetR/AcrR family transcriptional regulator n=1 Tax=Nocardia spumae TaxID=2887190 RepID=UPI001D14E715|nr:TetR/AcrR family transcriptional regulator [Nocardia spumae]